jgi:hypothetical protein
MAKTINPLIKRPKGLTIGLVKNKAENTIFHFIKKDASRRPPSPRTTCPRARCTSSVSACAWARLAAPRSGGTGASSRRQHLSSSASARSRGGGNDRARARVPRVLPLHVPRQEARQGGPQRGAPLALHLVHALRGAPRRARRRQSPREPLQQETARRSAAPQAWSPGRCPRSRAFATWSPIHLHPRQGADAAEDEVRFQCPITGLEFDPAGDEVRPCARLPRVGVRSSRVHAHDLHRPYHLHPPPSGGRASPRPALPRPRTAQLVAPALSRAWTKPTSTLPVSPRRALASMARTLSSSSRLP